jgi:hypothetical protein
VPSIVEALEHQFEEIMPDLARTLKKRRWDYARDHFTCSYWFGTTAPKMLLETIGVDNVMFETDYPHPPSLYPGVRDHLLETLGGYDYEICKKILQSITARLYNLPF